MKEKSTGSEIGNKYVERVAPLIRETDIKNSKMREISIRRLRQPQRKQMRRTLAKGRGETEGGAARTGEASRMTEQTAWQRSWGGN